MRVQVPPSASGSPEKSGEPFVVPPDLPTGWCVYALRLSDGRFYTGMTERLAERFVEHASGRGPTVVRLHLPIELVWYEELFDAVTARRVEKWLKRRGVNEKVNYFRTNGILLINPVVESSECEEP